MSLHWTFLHTMRREPQVLGALMTKLGITAEQLTRWLESKRFRRELRKSYFILGCRRELELQLLRCKATGKTEDILEGKERSPVVQRTCQALVLRDEPRPRRSSKSTPPPPTQLIHPDVDPDEADALVEKLSA